MAKQLLVLPAECKDNIDPNHKTVADKIADGYEIFYAEEKSYDAFKKYIADNSFDTVIYAYAGAIRDSKNLRAVKALNLNTKIVLLYPQISNIKTYKSAEKNINDPVFQLLEKHALMETSNCMLADAVVVETKEEKEIVLSETTNVSVNASDEILSSGGLDIADKPKPSVSIIMLTFNQLEDTKTTVESLFKHTADVSYELIFVDNGSTKDDTKTYLEGLKSSNSNVKVIYNDENLGFACANNQGIEMSEGEYVLLLNNDVILTDGWLSRMLEIAQSDKKAGLVVPCTNHASGKQVVVFDGTAEDDGEIQNFAKAVLSKNAGSWLSINRAIGFCMLLKREVLFKVGVLDELFGPGGYEDYDYCMRIKYAGYDIIMASDTFVFHIGGKGYSSNNLDYSNLRNKNIELLIDKWTRKNIEIMEKLPDGM